ncbi:hypothetical protein MFIFM68171_05511 [Madurella fahalii]|uniref:Uncharacterized protein n=1 Tax=Madurella fahalii TaxID=1157608 RepID=A0ABQ0GC02_9PEZI
MTSSDLNPSSSSKLGFYFSHAWMSFCNLVIFALTICIFIGCRTPAESSYGLINAPYSLLTASFGEECVNSSLVALPEKYTVGLAGSCRLTNTTTTCSSHPPGWPSLNWVQLYESDLLDTLSNLRNTTATTFQNAATTSTISTLNHCLSLTQSSAVDHAFNNRLASGLLALLVFSFLMNLAITSTAIFIQALYKSESAFRREPIFYLGLFDEILLVTCLGIYMGIMNHEVGGYIIHERRHEISQNAVLGIGFWLLFAVFGLRVVSHPALFVTTVLVALAIPVIFVSLTICCIWGMASLASAFKTVTVVYYY